VGGRAPRERGPSGQRPRRPGEEPDDDAVPRLPVAVVDAAIAPDLTYSRPPHCRPLAEQLFGVRNRVRTRAKPTYPGRITAAAQIVRPAAYRVRAATATARSPTSAVSSPSIRGRVPLGLRGRR